MDVGKGGDWAHCKGNVDHTSGVWWRRKGTILLSVFDKEIIWGHALGEIGSAILDDSPCYLAAKRRGEELPAIRHVVAVECSPHCIAVSKELAAWPEQGVEEGAVGANTMEELIVIVRSRPGIIFCKCFCVGKGTGVFGHFLGQFAQAYRGFIVARARFADEQRKALLGGAVHGRGVPRVESQGEELANVRCKE